jgi:hypothetical protein
LPFLHFSAPHGGLLCDFHPITDCLRKSRTDYTD